MAFMNFSRIKALLLIFCTSRVGLYYPKSPTFKYFFFKFGLGAAKFGGLSRVQCAFKIDLMWFIPSQYAFSKFTESYVSNF